MNFQWSQFAQQTKHGKSLNVRGISRSKFGAIRAENAKTLGHFCSATLIYDLTNGGIADGGISVTVQGFLFEVPSVISFFVLLWYCELLLPEIKGSALLLQRGCEPLRDFSGC